ncbi:potassium voltage-gated channel protein Shaw-like [Mercenaria mercenaria]|uniref:potassium voltage-gated channel protein Shaw-like n=1 Tax=Mercenaria mercenaria TaxID=6596 RepID=UPI00234EE1AB|nr:potassium voltage-gated channel protein Shaw-like [Mercenaria mercenaria]
MEGNIEMLNNSIVTLNIGGTIFKCYAKTLTAFPDSKLAHLNFQCDFYDSKQKEYFFDRDPVLFSYILDSFRKGAIHLPNDVCGTTFKEELEFWEISPRYVAPCCWGALYRSEGDKATMNALIQRFQQNPNTLLMQEKKLGIRSKLWLFFDEPVSSRPALVWSVFISCVIVMSTVVDFLSTMETFQEDVSEAHSRLFSEFADTVDLENTTLARFVTRIPQKFPMVTNVVCHTILTLELVVSFIICENKKVFGTCVFRHIATFGYLSYWISFTICSNLIYLDSMYAIIACTMFNYLSIFKCARLFYLTRSVPAFRIMRLTFESSKQELKILIFLLGILVCVFGYVMFAAEFTQNAKITNAFKAVYWALITLTTVGYGDVVPNTAAVHVIAGACAVCGVLVLALPVGIIVSKFYKFYDYYDLAMRHSETFVKPLISQKAK